MWGVRGGAWFRLIKRVLTDCPTGRFPLAAEGLEFVFVLYKAQCIIGLVQHILSVSCIILYLTVCVVKLVNISLNIKNNCTVNFLGKIIDFFRNSFLNRPILRSIHVFKSVMAFMPSYLNYVFLTMFSK